MIKPSIEVVIPNIKTITKGETKPITKISSIQIQKSAQSQGIMAGTSTMLKQSQVKTQMKSPITSQSQITIPKQSQIQSPIMGRIEIQSQIQQQIQTPLTTTSILTKTPTTSIPKITIPTLPFPSIGGGGFFPSASGGGFSMKVKSFKAKSKIKYRPSLYGMFSGRKSYRMPKMLTGMEPRYPIGRRPRKSKPFSRKIIIKIKR
jgi:hypothetical protein